MVHTDQDQRTHQVRLPPGGKPGDDITFEASEEDTKPDDYPTVAELEHHNNNRRPNLVTSIFCCCVYVCCPDGIVVSEWFLAFMIGLYIGLSLMLGFALGILSLREDINEPEL